MKKKVTAMAMTMAVMAASLTACSSKSAAPAETTAAATEAAKETEAASEAPTETEAAAAESDSVEGALKGVKLKFGTTALFAPFTYYDTDGTTLIGFDVEFMEALKDYLGFELDGDIQVMDYSALTTSLAEGKLDVGMAALCATDTRKEVMNFSETYYDAGQVVMVNTETSPKEITDEEALKSGDYKVAVEKGTASHMFAQENFPESCIEVHDTITTAYESLEQGKVDACLQDLAGAAYYVKTTENTKLAIAGDDFNQGQSPYAIALSFKFCDANPDVIDVINKAIDELTANGTMDELEAKWCE